MSGAIATESPRRRAGRCLRHRRGAAPTHATAIDEPAVNSEELAGGPVEKNELIVGATPDRQARRHPEVDASAKKHRRVEAGSRSRDVEKTGHLVHQRARYPRAGARETTFDRKKRGERISPEVEANASQND